MGNSKVGVGWFTRSKQPDPWDTDDGEPIGDIEAVTRIRNICDAAAPLAANVRSGVGGPSEKERYERAAKAAMSTTMKIKDDLMRDAALRRIIELCIIADNLRTAQTLMRAIQAVSIRETLFSNYPLRG
jgi:hypothetical protein